MLCLAKFVYLKLYEIPVGNGVDFIILQCLQLSEVGVAPLESATLLLADSLKRVAE